MPDTLGINYRLDMQVLTPLHIGNGVTLKQGFDFEVNNGLTYRLNEDIILTDKWPNAPDQQRIFLNQPLAKLLERSDFSAHPEYFGYTLHGVPVMKEIRECIRDAQGRPYIPGSSLKGALRTALLRALTDKHTFQRGDFGPSGGTKEAKQAAQDLEHKQLGRDPNRDVLRAIQISDSDTLPTTVLTLQRVQMVPQLNIDVEAIQRGARLTAVLRLDTWLLAQHGRSELDWPDKVVNYVRHIAQVAQCIAVRRLHHEWRYHAKRQDGAAAMFYGKLFEEANSEAWPKDEFLVQMGFATGWRAKTVTGGLDNDDPLLETLVHDFNLDRGGGKQSRGYKRGQPFPKARHLAWIGNNPALPMGWLRVHVIDLQPEKQDTSQEESHLPVIPSKRPEETVEIVQLLPTQDETPPDQPLPLASPDLVPPGELQEENTPVASGPGTGTVIRYNLSQGVGLIQIDGSELEVEIRADQLRKGVRFLAAGRSVSFTVVIDDNRVHLRDVCPT